MYTGSKEDRVRKRLLNYKRVRLDTIEKAIIAVLFVHYWLVYYLTGFNNFCSREERDEGIAWVVCAPAGLVLDPISSSLSCIRNIDRRPDEWPPLPLASPYFILSLCIFPFFFVFFPFFLNSLSIINVKIECTPVCVACRPPRRG